jgi:hypothetical protein
MKMIEIEKTYKITFSDEQLQELFNLLVRNANDLRGTALNPIYYELKDIYNPTAI